MGEVVREFAFVVEKPESRRFLARVRGEPDAAGVWHGWIEFLPQDGGPALRTGRETTQSSREQLEYWAAGLTATYLEMALRRASRRGSAAPTPPPVAEPAFDPAHIHGSQPGAPVVRLEVETLDPALPLRLMATPELAEGRTRRIPGGGILVYDGVTAPEGGASRYAFLLQYGSENAAAVLANRLWSELHGEGAALFIEGVRVEIDNHEMNERLKALLQAARG